jgi:hypothetical protein
MKIARKSKLAYIVQSSFRLEFSPHFFPEWNLALINTTLGILESLKSTVSKLIVRFVGNPPFAHFGFIKVLPVICNFRRLFILLADFYPPLLVGEYTFIDFGLG